MYLVDMSSKLSVDSFEDLLAATDDCWSDIYEKMDPRETLWVFVPNRYEGTKSWSPAMLLADYVRNNTQFSLRNTVVRHTTPESGSGLQCIYETILFFVKDASEYLFNKDNIRIEHVYKGNEWGDRSTGQSAYHDLEIKRYNPDGKDPGNVWLNENRGQTDDETVDEIKPLSRTEAVKRCIRASSEEDEIIYGLWLSDEFINIIEKEERRYEEMEVDSTETSIKYRPWVVDTPLPNRIKGKSEILRLDDLEVYFQSAEDMYDIEDGSVQSIITSPPYWNLKDYGHEDEIGAADESYEHYHERMKRVWKECYNALAPNGTMWVVVDTVVNRGDLRLLPQHIANNATDLGFNHWDNIVWYKPTSIAGMSPRNIVNKHEYIIALSKNSDFKLNPELEADNGVEDPAVLESGPLGNIFRHPVKRGTIGQNVLHKAPYPSSLIERIIRLSTDPGDRILDPFLGSGTTAEAAIDLGRECVGYEINPEFRDLIKERVSQHLLSEY